MDAHIEQTPSSGQGGSQVAAIEGESWAAVLDRLMEALGLSSTPSGGRSGNTAEIEWEAGS